MTPQAYPESAALPFIMEDSHRLSRPLLSLAFTINALDLTAM
jgi:hypothetical protein